MVKQASGQNHGSDHGQNVNFDKHGATVYKGTDKTVEMRAVKVKDAYYARTSIENERTAAVKSEKGVWCNRSGHVSKETIEQMRTVVNRVSKEKPASNLTRESTEEELSVL